MKQSSLGLIPNDWDVFSLGQLGEVKMCKRVMKHQTLSSGEIPFYKIGTFGGTPDAYIARDLFEDFRSRFSYPKKGDILLSAAGTIGRTVVFDGMDSYFQDSNIVWIDNKEDKVLNCFLYYCYKIMRFNTENGGIVVRLYNENLRNTTFVAPKFLAEQKRIANALTGIDRMIGALDEAIGKKRQIKEGLMQQLLTGKTRLPGFGGEWKERRLDSFEIVNGAMLKSSEYETGNVPVIAGGQTPAGFHSNANRPANTITISGSGAYAGFVSFHTVPIFASDCSTIDNPKDADIIYLYFCLLSKQKEIYKCQAGGAQPHVHAKDIKDITIMMPPSVEEQKAISVVLTKSEDEIKGLECQRNKYVLIKQGMMQELLTGKTRL